MTEQPVNPRPPATQGMPLTCGKCGYELRGTRLNDGRAICAECGAIQDGVPVPRGPLSGDDFAQIEASQRRGKKIRKAARVASFNAWTGAVIGGSALMFGIVDRTSAIIGGAIMVVAIIEFKGAAKFRRVDLAAPMICGFNQLLLLAIISAYCVWNLAGSSASLSQSIGDPMGDALLADVAGMEGTLRRGLYGLVLIGSVLMQGFTALYYFTRARHMRPYLRDTPPWVVELQRRSA